jgi:hypothetical protein
MHFWFVSSPYPNGQVIVTPNEPQLRLGVHLFVEESKIYPLRQVLQILGLVKSQLAQGNLQFLIHEYFLVKVYPSKHCEQTAPEQEKQLETHGMHLPLSKWKPGEQIRQTEIYYLHIEQPD